MKTAYFAAMAPESVTILVNGCKVKYIKVATLQKLLDCHARKCEIKQQICEKTKVAKNIGS